MMIHAIAVDDESLALTVVESFCAHFPFIKLDKTFNKPNEALKYLEKFPTDLLFLDINMPSLSGIDFYKSLKQTTMVIFTTAYSEYAVEGFNLSAVDYLLKPFTLERFEQAVQRASDFYEYQHKKPTETVTDIYIRADYTLNKIGLSDILYIEGLDDYVKVHTRNAKPLVARMTIKALVEKLPANDFIRVHRSFIVPFKLIKGVRNKMILIGESSIPLGASYESAFMERLKNSSEEK